MTIANLLTSDFLVATKSEIEDQTAELQEELNQRLAGSNYHRETSLACIYPGITPRAVPREDRITPEDIAYTTELIAELKGRLQAQKAHRDLQSFTPSTIYNYVMHGRILGALQAEIKILAWLLDTHNHAQSTVALIKDLQGGVVRAAPSDTPRGQQFKPRAPALQGGNMLAKSQPTPTQ